MSDPSPQPMILVKKTDGSSVRMTADEFRAYREASRGGAGLPKKGHAPASHPPAHHRDGGGSHAKPHHAKQSAPHQPMAPASASKPHGEHPKKASAEALPAWKPDDHQSLLAPELHTDLPVISQKSAMPPATPPSALSADTASAGAEGERNDQVVRILQDVGWDVRPDVRKRLESLIVSRLKDVRNNEQFLSYAMTPSHRGGVSLSPDQARELLSAIERVAPSKILPPPRPILVPRQTPPPALNETGAASALLPSAPKSDARPAGKPAMHDVTPSPKTEGQMGPREEFLQMTLADFRRLGASTDAAASRLKEKFDTMKDESYLLFMESREAWYQSPLYQSYITAAAAALQQKRRLSEFVPEKADPGTLTMDVIQAVVGVNKYVAI